MMKTWCTSERRSVDGARLRRALAGRMSSMASRKEEFRKAARRFGLPRLFDTMNFLSFCSFSSSVKVVGSSCLTRIEERQRQTVPRFVGGCARF